MSRFTSDKWEAFQKLAVDTREKDEKICLNILKKNNLDRFWLREIQINLDEHYGFNDYSSKKNEILKDQDRRWYGHYRQKELGGYQDIINGSRIIKIIESFDKVKSDINEEELEKCIKLYKKYYSKKFLLQGFRDHLIWSKLRELGAFDSPDSERGLMKIYLEIMPHIPELEKTLEELKQYQEDFQKSDEIYSVYKNIDHAIEDYYKAPGIRDLYERLKIDKSCKVIDPEWIDVMEEYLEKGAPQFLTTSKSKELPKEEPEGPSM